MAKKSSGLGSVTQRPDGRWWARGPRPARASLGTYDTREEADAVRGAAVRQLATADRAYAPGSTLREFGTCYLDAREHEAPRSVRAERSRWHHVEAADFIDDPIATLSPPVVDAWARALTRTLPDSAGYVLTLLSQICHLAVRRGLLAANPCASIRVRRRARTHEPWTYLLPDEQRALLAAPIPQADRLTIAVALFTGVREGELFNLHLPDVHLEGPHPHIVVRFGSDEGATKGRRIRRVPLLAPALAALRAWLELLPAWAPYNPLQLVFPGRKGGFRGESRHLHRNERHDGALVRVDGFAEALELAGIVAAKRHDGRPVRWHDLRHTCGSSLVAGWWGQPWRLEEVKELLGHRSITTTQRYAHLTPEALPTAATPGLRVGYEPPRLVAPRAADAVDPAPEAALVPENPYFSPILSVCADLPAASPTDTPAAALAVLRALARHDIAGARAAAAPLVDEQLEQPLVRAALAVRDRGPAEEASLVELAEAALELGDATRRRRA